MPINLNLWRVKRIHKRIQKYQQQRRKFESYVEKVDEWILQEKKKLYSELQSMQDDDVLLFGMWIGCIENDRELLAGLKKKKGYPLTSTNT